MRMSATAWKHYIITSFESSSLLHRSHTHAHILVCTELLLCCRTINFNRNDYITLRTGFSGSRLFTIHKMSTTKRVSFDCNLRTPLLSFHWLLQMFCICYCLAPFKPTINPFIFHRKRNKIVSLLNIIFGCFVCGKEMENLITRLARRKWTVILRQYEKPLTSWFISTVHGIWLNFHWRCAKQMYHKPKSMRFFFSNGPSELELCRLFCIA